MKRIERYAVILSLVDKLHENDSWCGETHVQKAVYLVQELLGVPLNFEAILYKHGPYSFELTDELTAMRAEGLLYVQPQDYPYGPSLVPTSLGAAIQTHVGHHASRFDNQLEFVARLFSNRGVSELEKLSTAHFVTRRLGQDSSVEDRATLLHKLKKHIPTDEALASIQQIDKVIEDSGSVVLRTGV